MTALELEAARSVRCSIPAIARPHPWWPERDQIGWCWFLALVIAAEIVTIGMQLWRRA